MLPDDLYLQLAAGRELRYQPLDSELHAKWAANVRDKLGQCLRSDLWPSEFLSVETEMIEQCDGFKRERIVFDAGPLFSGSAYVLTPDDDKGAHPGILCLHGHGGYMAGKDMVAQPDETHPMAKECGDALNYGYGVQLAKSGFVTLCPDAFNFGERLFAKDQWAEDHICERYFLGTLVFGHTPLGITVGTNCLLLDYLFNRPDVVSDKAGCVGLSYGGTQTLFTMVMEPRLVAGVISGSLYSIRLQIAANGGATAGGACGAQSIPGLMEWFDVDDLAKSLAPRPIHYELMQRDSCFDYQRSQKVYEDVREAYLHLGVGELVDLDSPDTDHRYFGEKVPSFFSKHLTQP